MLELFLRDAYISYSIASDGKLGGNEAMSLRENRHPEWIFGVGMPIFIFPQVNYSGLYSQTFGLAPSARMKIAFHHPLRFSQYLQVHFLR